MSNLPADRLKKISNVLDSLIKIPGTRLSIGLDGIIGLIPGIGDGLSSLFSFYIVYQAAIAGVPYLTVIRMLLNICIDTTIGGIPLLGDLFDVAWKSNLKNLELINRIPSEKLKPRTNSQIKTAFAVFLIAMFTALLILTYLLIQQISGIFIS